MKSDFENVGPFGHKFGLNLAHLAQYCQICSFKGRDLKFTLNEHFSKLWKIFKSNLENQIPSKHDTDVLQYGSNLIGAEIKNGDHDEVNSKSVVVNGDELLDKDMLPVVEKMKNIVLSAII